MMLAGDENIITSLGKAAADGMAIYYHGYRSRIEESMSALFPKLKVMMQDEWPMLIEQLVIDSPSKYVNLADYGASLVALLLEKNPKSAIHHQAGLEWACYKSFTAADEPQFMREELLAISPEDWLRLCFTFASHVILLPARILWRENHQVHSAELTQVESTIFSAQQQAQSFQTIADELQSLLAPAEIAPAMVRCIEYALLHGMYTGCSLY